MNEDGKFEPIYAQNNGSELWVLLLEKAFAKLNGSYDSLNEGYLSHSLTNLTGAPVKQIKIRKEFQDLSESAEYHYYNSLFTRLKKYKEKGYLTCSSTPHKDEMVRVSQFVLFCLPIFLKELL